MRRALVIGGGVAGSCAAAFLAAARVQVVVVDRLTKSEVCAPFKVGESLPPDAKKLLTQLGVWAQFEADAHLPCYYNKSYWGSGQLACHDFMNHPMGHGWHIDREKFERMLSAHAAKRGASVFYNTRITAVYPTDNGWRVNHAPVRKDFPCEFDFIIDASGRNSWFARRQGVRRVADDRQLALVAFLKALRPLEDSASLIESVNGGWWYSAAAPGNRVATVFVSPPGKTQQQGRPGESAWWKLLSNARHTAHRINEAGFELATPPQWVAAHSSILQTSVGEGWLAVGDAAMTYDPIAAHGIMMAMVSARDAAAAIVEQLAGDQGALTRYNDVMRQAYSRYRQERQGLYAQSGGFGKPGA
jgi:2-polyprenyl-6-methoxyphenol hydroxylase-like FAD-dependent oxidoreductase